MDSPVVRCIIRKKEKPMREYFGHLIPIDLYYFVLSYLDNTNYEWFKEHGLGQWDIRGIIPPKELTSGQIDSLIMCAVEWNVSRVVHKVSITEKDLDKLI